MGSSSRKAVLECQAQSLGLHPGGVGNHLGAGKQGSDLPRSDYGKFNVINIFSVNLKLTFFFFHVKISDFLRSS